LRFRSDFDARAVPSRDSNCRYGHNNSKYHRGPEYFSVFNRTRRSQPYDESGQIELRVDATVAVANGNASIQRITFQVTTLAEL
jgi:hypothetical protein